MARSSAEGSSSGDAIREAGGPESDEAFESTPLLSQSGSAPRYDGDADAPSPTHSPRDGVASQSGGKVRRWPSIAAMGALALVSVAIIVVAFFVPAAVEEYAKEALVVEPTNLALDSITSNGVRARVQANIRLDAQRVTNDHVRRIGKITTWLVRELGTDETTINVHLPGYDGKLLGKAGLPPLTINLVDGRNTAIDLIADLTPGDAESYRIIANDWLEGRLETIRIQAKADVRLRSGMIPLGTHNVVESLTLEGQQKLYRSFIASYFGKEALRSMLPSIE
jgi:hypothetical protein